MEIVSRRRTAQQALKESESLNRTILASLNTHVCVLDREARIICVNHAWAAFALDNGLTSEASVGPGVSYLDVCRKAAQGDELVHAAMDGIQAVCDGTKEYFELDYPCHSPTEKRWFLMVVTPLKNDKGGAVVVHHDVTDRELAAQALRESKTRLTETLEQLEMAASAGNVGMWTRSIDGEIIWASEKAGEIFGFSNGERFTQAELIELLHPDDHERVMSCLEALASGKEEYHIEFRIVAKDDSLRWVQSQGRIETVYGTPVVRGAVVDITKQKLAEDRIRDLNHKLISTQEIERARVARELHDDLSQNIALLSIELGMLRKEPKNLAFVSKQLGEFISDVKRLLRDVRRISYELHPVNLIQLGLDDALREFCRKFPPKHGIEIDLATQKISSPISSDISLCLYRITQESLQNVVKHSKATTAQIRLTGDNTGIVLTIVDNGRGFDPDGAKTKSGLGLTSMAERARHVNGRVRITSAPGEGATVEVRVPFDSGVVPVRGIPAVAGKLFPDA